jgi:predicted ArsR family transcriptional regulator
MPVYDDRIDMKILRVLFEKKKINFSGFGYLGIAKESRRRHLARLEALKLIRSDKTPSWRSGQSINYTLTDKGINHYIQKAGEDISQAFETLSGILDEWSRKPELFKKYRRETCMLNQLETDSTDDNIMLPEIKRRLENAIEAFDMLQITLDFHVGFIKEKNCSI